MTKSDFTFYDELILLEESESLISSDYKNLKMKIGEFFEGKSLVAYQDTVGKWTVGIGNNFDDMGFTAQEERSIRLRLNDFSTDIKTLVIDNGISEDECRLMFAYDSKKAEDDAKKLLEHFDDFNDVRKAAICDFSFNVGYNTFKSFKNTRRYLDNFDFKNAAKGFENSKWFNQVGRRGPLIVEMIKTGKLPEVLQNL